MHDTRNSATYLGRKKASVDKWQHRRFRHDATGQDRKWTPHCWPYALVD